MKDNSYYKTSDLGLATSLVSLEFELLEMDKSNQKKIWFIFPKTNEIEETANKYWANKLELPARLFFDNIRMLKSKMYNER